VRRRRTEALAAVDEACPRCSAPRDPAQEFCVECGFQLPPARGRVPSLRRGWLRRFGWYPGDWIWISLLTFLVAAAGAAVAIAATSNGGSSGGSTVVAPPPVQATSTTATPPPPPATTTTTTTTTRATTTTVAHTTTAKTPPPPPPTTTTAPNGETSWPAGENGWTNVLISYPTSDGTAVPAAAALRAAHRGLPQVGVLDSSDYSSLHPGYDVVFSGVYSTPAEAAAALATAHAAGFEGAYTRQISR
jgi:hypothetical protein